MSISLSFSLSSGKNLSRFCKMWFTKYQALVKFLPSYYTEIHVHINIAIKFLQNSC